MLIVNCDHCYSNFEFTVLGSSLWEISVVQCVGLQHYWLGGSEQVAVMCENWHFNFSINSLKNFKYTIYQPNS